MKIKRILDDTGMDIKELEELLSSDKIVVKKITAVPLTNDEGIATTNFYIFYEDVEEALATEKGVLNALKPIAERVRSDPVYKELKNQKERQLYLLEAYNLPKETADNVTEWIKIVEIIESKQ